MKFRTLFGFGLLVALAASCALNEPAAPEEEQALTIQAGFETVGAGTRVSVDEDYNVTWDEGDEISIFYRNTANLRFVLAGEPGGTSAVFKSAGGFGIGERIPYLCGFYPYSADVKLTQDGDFSIEWPAEQVYAEHGYGPGANPMVAVSESDKLYFRSIGGYLVLPLWGDKVAVESITLKGNGGEPLSGPATVYAGPSSAPSVYMGEDAGDQIVLVCKKPVLIGETEEDATPFWFVIPPTCFYEGFTISVLCTSGEVLEFSAEDQEETYQVERNTLFSMDPLCIKAAVINVTGVTVEPEELSLIVEETAQLTATIAPEDATFQTVTWSSSNPDVADVDDDGFVTAVAEGEATITVTTDDGELTAECIVTVSPKPVTGITVEPATLVLAVGDDEEITWEIEPADAGNQDVSWYIEGEEGIITYDNGVITAIGVGTATLWIETDDGHFTGGCTVTTYMPGRNLPYEETFENDFGDLDFYDVANNEEFDVWTYSGQYGAVGTGYVDLDGDGMKEYYQAESHLVTPYLDLRDETQVILYFHYAINFGVASSYDNQFWLEVTDGAETTRIAVPNLPTQGSWSYRDAAVDLSPFCGKTVRIEFVYNSIGLTDAAPTVEIDHIKVSTEKVPATITAPITLTTTVGKTPQLVVSTNSDGTLQFFSNDESVVTVSETGVVEAIGEGVATITISVPETACYAAATVYCEATVLEVPTVDYETVYTSNVDLSASTTGSVSASTCKVKYGNDSFDGLKGGTGSAAGAVAVTVPKGTTKLHLHAFAWKGDTVTLTVSGATSSPTSINISANAGVSGNSPYTVTTLDGSYYCLNLSNVTSNTIVVLKATKGKRFVVWGVNAE